MMSLSPVPEFCREIITCNCKRVDAKLFVVDVKSRISAQEAVHTVGVNKCVIIIFHCHNHF